ncbi:MULTISPECIES: hypothetical protein [unclassified Pseudoalteromonas]|uniref:hypothetical protein n=1 Tax=unclassified Pseudoalteromonas TaxID=194690 RepID=UPI0020983FD6|nr:hypothetical protein [Pseudoalteromonas sp. XMcav2-N]MCO7188970.1 hypothetical protein [Pseudoalteromonas sp. XMcav2-N]
MRIPLLSLVLVVSLSGCQLSPNAHKSSFIGPSKTVSPDYAPLTVLLKRYLQICQQALPAKHNKSERYIGQAAIETFMYDYCNTVSTTRQLRAITAIEQSQPWPQHYHLWFSTLKQQSQVLRGQKIRLHRSNAKLTQIQSQLSQTSQALMTLKQELVDIEQQRLQDVPLVESPQAPKEQQ